MADPTLSCPVCAAMYRPVDPGDVCEQIYADIREHGLPAWVHMDPVAEVIAQAEPDR